MSSSTSLPIARHRVVHEQILDLGLQPVSNRFVESSGRHIAPCFPLSLVVDSHLGLVSLQQPFPVQELRPRFDWISCFEPEGHLDQLVKTLIALPGIESESSFAAYSFKDDSTLQRLNRLGYKKTWRIDPKLDLAVPDLLANVETYQSLFTEPVAHAIRQRHGPADVLIVRHVLEHANDLVGFMDSLRCLVRPGGYIVLEVPDCERAMVAGDCTIVWEEHTYYFTKFTLLSFLAQSGLDVKVYESIPYPLENSLIAIVQVPSAFKARTFIDGASVLIEITRARQFAQKVNLRRSTVRRRLEQLRKVHGGVCMFGAGHLSVAFISINGVADLINYVIDDNPNKCGMHMPLAHLPIVRSQALETSAIGVCLLGLNPKNHAKIIAKNSSFKLHGGLFVSIFPGTDYSSGLLQ